MSLAGLAGFPAGLMQGQQFAQQQQLAMLRMQAEIARRRQQQEQEQAMTGVMGVARQLPSPMAPQPTGGQVAGAQDLTSAVTQRPPAPSPGGPPMTPNLVGGANWQGENPEFQRRVGALLASEPPDIRAASAIESGYRSPEEQAKIYAKSGQGTSFAAAPPGASWHQGREALGFGPGGMAADWRFQTPQANQAIHRDAGRFGLSFPFVVGGAGAGGKLSDPNHMQLASTLGLSPPEHDQSKQLADGIGSQIPPQFSGQVDINGLARLIDRTAGPGVPDHVKAMTLGYLVPLMNQNSQAQFHDVMEALKYKESVREHDIMAGQRDATLGQTAELARERMAQPNFQFIQTPDGIVRASPKTGQIEPTSLPAGSGKLGAPTKPGAVLPDDVAEVLADQGIAGDQSWKTNLGRGAQGAENIAKVETIMARKMKEQGMSGSDLATRNAEYGGLKAGERTLSTRTANIGMRINEAQRFAPLAEQASEGVDRSKYKLWNQMENAWLEGTGDENIIKLMVYSQSFMNAYAAAVTPTGQPTEGAQARARHNLDIAWSRGQYKTAVDAMLVEMDQASKSPGAVREEFRTGPGAPAIGGNPTTGPASGGMPGGAVIKLDANGNVIP